MADPGYSRPSASRLAINGALLRSLLWPYAALIAWRVLVRSAVHRGSRLNVLLITIDTLRADAIGAYGRPAPDTLDGSARPPAASASTRRAPTTSSRCRLTQTYSPAGCPPIMASATTPGFGFRPTEETLATMLKERGYRTGAFVSAFPLDSRFGLARGFDVYDDSFVDATPRPALLVQERRGPARSRSRRDGSSRRTEAAVVLLGASLRAALSVRAAGAVTMRVSPATPMPTTSPRWTRRSARSSSPSSRRRVDAHARRPDIGSWRIAWRSRRGDARNLRLRSDTEGPAHRLSPSAAEPARLDAGRHVDIRRRFSTRLVPAVRWPSWPQPDRRSSRRSGAARHLLRSAFRIAEPRVGAARRRRRERNEVHRSACCRALRSAQRSAGAAQPRGRAFEGSARPSSAPRDVARRRHQRTDENAETRRRLQSLG